MTTEKCQHEIESNMTMAYCRKCKILLPPDTMKDEYTNLEVSRVVKHDISWVASEKNAEMFWVNHYFEGRKEVMTSGWRLQKEKPKSPKVRYYPAYSKKYFTENILPQLFISITNL